MNKDENLYIKVLEWAYQKKETGFTKDELRTDLAIGDELWPWVHWQFFNGLNGASPLIWIMDGVYTVDGVTRHDRYYLSAAGTAAMYDYLELHEAREESSKARFIGYVSLLVSVLAFIGLVYSIHLQIVSNNNTNEELRILNAKAKLHAEIFTYNKNYTSPLEESRMGISIRNIGEANTSNWSVYLIPCNAVEINDISKEFGGITEEGGYWIKGNRVLPSDQALFLPQADEVGSFNLKLSTSTPIISLNDQRITPLALTHMSGENINPTMNLLYVNWVEDKSQFKSIEVSTEQISLCKSVSS